jgi:hypothetical protein
MLNRLDPAISLFNRPVASQLKRRFCKAVKHDLTKIYLRRMTMKRTIFAFATVLVVFLAVFAVLVLRPVSKVKAHQGCSNRTLFGVYGVTSSSAHQNGGSETTAGLAHFDGDGGWSITENWDLNRFTSSGPGSATGGTYEVNSDCSVTITSPPPAPFTYLYGVIVANGSEAFGVLFTPSTATDSNPANAEQGTWDAKKVEDSE